jgi:hypothetical protein
MKRSIFLSLALCFAGCTTLAPPKQVESLRSTKPFMEIAELLNSQTKKCWKSEVGPLKDGIRIESNLSTQQNIATINGRRVNWGVGLAAEPFIIVKISSSGSETLVDILEGDFSKGIAKSSRLEAGTHVAKWLAGDLECKPFDSTLWHS